jgi:glycosyltransferase involved in cell wall biosynthesis
MEMQEVAIASTAPGLVSIVIPCYKGARYLSEAIESCLRQSYQNIEIIVVDDASPDNCAEIADGFARRDSRVRVIRRPVNGGVSRAFNSGFEVARGAYFSRLAQDDLFAEDAVPIMVRHLEAHRSVGLVYCDMQSIDEQGRLTERRPTLDAGEVLSDGGFLGFCVMWRKSVWDTVGGFDLTLDTAEDYEYWLRIQRHFPISKCPGVAPFFARDHDLRGSIQFACRQQIAVAFASARYCDSWLEARRLKSRGYFDAAYIHKRDRRFASALYHLALAAIYWPFDFRLYRCAVGVTANACVSRQRSLFKWSGGFRP